MQFKDLHTFWQSFSQHIADLKEFQETNESFFWDPALRKKSGYTDDGRLCNGRRFYMTFLLSGPVHFVGT